MNPRIKFSHVWDKLAEPEWTTIRSWNEEKEKYYRQQVGKQFTVLYIDKPWPPKNGKLICYAYLRNVVLSPGQLIPDEVLYKDVKIDGVPQMDWYKKIRKMDKAILLHFSRSPCPQQILDIHVSTVEKVIIQ